MAVKLVTSLPEESIATLSTIAQRNKITFTAALRQAIANEDFVNSELLAGARFLVQKRSGEVREIIFSPQRASTASMSPTL